MDQFSKKETLENCRKLSDLFNTKLNELKDKYGFIQEVRCKGLMIGIEMDKSPLFFLDILREKGLLALPAGEKTLRLLPPLLISEEDALKGIKIIDENLDKHWREQ